MSQSSRAASGRRVLFATHVNYLDAGNGASVASRMLMESPAQWGFHVLAMSGTMSEASLGSGLESANQAPKANDAGGVLRINRHGVPVLLHSCPHPAAHVAEEPEANSFLSLLVQTLESFQPDVVITFGGDQLAEKIRQCAKSIGAVVVFALHNFNYPTRIPFETADTVVVPSRFSAAYHRKLLGLECTVLPNMLDPGRVEGPDRKPQYVTFVNPSAEKGVYAFARITHQLGKCRPDIPVLVVESRGTESTLVSCGLDLRDHGNIFLMSHTDDPRDFWDVTKLCVMPSLWWESHPLVAIEAMANGIPVIASDRGALPETLGDAGIILPLPNELSPATRELPSADGVDPWVRAIIALWDDPVWYEEKSRLARAHSSRWLPEKLKDQYLRFLEGLNAPTRPHQPPSP